MSAQSGSQVTKSDRGIFGLYRFIDVTATATIKKKSPKLGSRSLFTSAPDGGKTPFFVQIAK